MTRSQKRALRLALYHAARAIAAWLIMAGLLILLCFVP
jgi:hypothetical protein